MHVVKSLFVLTLVGVLALSNNNAFGQESSITWQLVDENNYTVKVPQSEGSLYYAQCEVRIDGNEIYVKVVGYYGLHTHFKVTADGKRSNPHIYKIDADGEQVPRLVERSRSIVPYQIEQAFKVFPLANIRKKLADSEWPEKSKDGFW
jgi:hypothetical protein